MCIWGVLPDRLPRAGEPGGGAARPAPRLGRPVRGAAGHGITITVTITSTIIITITTFTTTTTTIIITTITITLMIIIS